MLHWVDNAFSWKPVSKTEINNVIIYLFDPRTHEKKEFLIQINCRKQKKTPKSCFRNELEEIFLDPWLGLDH